MDFHTETGRPSLDLIATLGDRGGDGLERLPDTAAATAWFRTVARYPIPEPLSAHDLSVVLGLRNALCRVADTVFAGRVPAAEDIDVVNRYAAIQASPPQLAKDGRTLTSNQGTTLEAALGEIARDAVDLLAGPELEKMKRCASDDCSVLFVDRSRPGKRRWCSMSRCGNQSKKRKYNAKTRELR
ncbi:4-hydroxybenzoyl-CoA reductase [Rhodospirillaceae bacterium KN72]|uniref:4-hydroxybenzoyl-CoA reductase n=1 Tax=Pacificispira spongiicola TaxID=2729598 RepID=A0A7Y0DZ46_9PROT|nr:CGNR zinc finger domain-containing protein [Pacificispira spongiicola]NMM44260.1 4-hydroxybenzoyl-CoA reductase [Pacificispira spongiicola]